MNGEKADWVAWIIKTVCGGVVGAFVPVFMFGVTRGESGPPLHLTPVDWSFWGTLSLSSALIFAALSSYQGHAFWQRLIQMNSLLPPEKPQHSANSRALSVGLGLIGVGILVNAVAKKSGFF